LIRTRRSACCLQRVSARAGSSNNWGLELSLGAYELTGKRPELGELKARLIGLKQHE
jgi:hypothetical protein